MSCRIWSHTCGSWYLPRFLFKEGLLALINMASLMYLVVPCASLWTMLKQSGLIGCPVEMVCWWMGDGALKCSLSLSLNALPVSPMYSSGQSICGHLYLYMTPLFCSLMSLSSDTINSIFIVFEPLKSTCIPFLLHILLNSSPNSCINGTTMERFLLLLISQLLTEDIPDKHPCCSLGTGSNIR